MSTRRRHFAGIMIGASLWSGTAVGQELLDNGSFNAGADGWLNQSQKTSGVQSEWLADCGRDGSGGLHIRSTGGEVTAIRIWRCVITSPPQNKALHISGWIKRRASRKAGGDTPYRRSTSGARARVVRIS